MARDRSMDVAVVGVAGWFPGRRDVEGLWSAVCRGERLMKRYSRDELITAGVPAGLVDDPDYVPVGGHLPDALRFDHALFRVTPRDAEMLDPQHRLMLEAAWAALEDAASGFGAGAPVTSVFASGSGSGYLRAMLSGGPLDPARLDQALHGTEPDFIASLIAYKLGLTGAAIGVQTACSSGLVGVHLATQALLAGECDQAVVVAAGIGYPQGGYLHLPGGVLSRTGVCRPFDAAADGVVAGSGVACVVLRRLANALRDGPPPHGVVLATAVNNDGAARAGYFAPSPQGQESVIRSAYAIAGVDAMTTRYLESHGTATRVGDPIEWSAASEALSGLGAEPGRVAVGALKANVGHLDAAAGIAGLIKALRVVKAGVVPPVAGFTRLNSLLETAGSPLYVPDTLRPWDGPRPRRASLSSFGIGGTNAHVVVEEPPAPAGPVSRSASAGPRLIVLSAMDAAGLVRSARRLADHLETAEVPVGDVARTLARGRAELPVRMAAVAAARARAVAALVGAADRGHGRVPAGGRPGLVFLFPGQGAQRPGMALPFIRALPGFRSRLDRCLDAFGELAVRLRRVLLDASADAAEVRDTGIAQPALFAVEHALAATLTEDIGLAPAAVAGHSLGEVTAACVAGMLSLDAAAAFVTARAAAMAACPPGAMLSLECDEPGVRTLIATTGLPVELAAVNGPGLCVVAGPADAVAAFRGAVNGIRSRVLRTSHAFHTSLMDSAVAALAAGSAPGDLSPAGIPLASGFTGTVVPAGSALSAGALVEHIRRPVRFGAALAGLAARFDAVTAVEIGPGTAVSTMAQYADLPAVPLDGPGEPDGSTVLAALGALWVDGHPVRLSRLAGAGASVHLPGYPFAGDHFLAAELTPREPAAAPAREPIEAPVEHVDAGELVRRLWSDLLGPAEPVGTADFFDLGGDSMLVTHLARRIKDATGASVPLRGLLSARTLDRQIELVNKVLAERT